MYMDETIIFGNLQTENKLNPNYAQSRGGKWKTTY
jgi:hypothetical protein